jgi:hypothetical protein
MGKTRWWQWKWNAPDPQEVQHVEHLTETQRADDYIARVRKLNEDLDALRKELSDDYVKNGKKV